MVNYKWFKKNVPKNIKVTQVYGIVFSSDGRVLLRIEDGKYTLTGGHPEKNEKHTETLRREYNEEINVTLKNIHYLGYQLVFEDNKEPYAQVRMIAKIHKVGKIRPDIDNGKIYDRKLVCFKNVKKYLNYSGTSGNEMIEDAIKLAHQIYNFEHIEEKEEMI